MRILSLTLHAVLISICIPCAAADFKPATGRYNEDISQIAIFVKNIGHYREICDQAFPDLQSANEEGYRKWKMRYQRVNEEIESHMSYVIKGLAALKPEQRQAMLSLLDDTYSQARESLRTGLTSEGKAQFRRYCEMYPDIVQTEKFNVERIFVEHLKTIRSARPLPVNK